MVGPRVELGQVITVPGLSGEREYVPRMRTFSRRTFDQGKKSGLNYRDLNMHGVGRLRRIRHTITIGETIKITRYKLWRTNEMAYGAGTTCELVLGFQGNLDLVALSQDVIPLTLKIETTVEEFGVRFFDGVYQDRAVRKGVDFYGIVDQVRPNYTEGTVTVTARSFAGILLMAKVALNPKTTETVTQIVQRLVREHGQGLKAVVDNFPDKVSDILARNLVTVGRLAPVWDLLEAFATAVHADLYVEGDTIRFVRSSVRKGDITQLAPGTKATYIYEFGVNVLEMEVEHSALFNHDTRVEVTSYNSRTHAITRGSSILPEARVKELARALETEDPQLADRVMADFRLREQRRVRVRRRRGTRSRARTRRKQLDPTKSALGISETEAPQHNAHRSRGARGRVQRGETVRAEAKAPAIRRTSAYRFELPNATQEQCDQVAEQIMKDIASREFHVTLKVLAQPYFNPRQYIQIKGTGSAVKDSIVYAIKSFSKSSVPPEEGVDEGGYTVTFSLVNHPVRSAGGVL